MASTAWMECNPCVFRHVAAGRTVLAMRTERTGTMVAIARPATRRAVAALSLAMLLASLGTSIANVALPTLAHAFGASFRLAQWVVLAYLCVDFGFWHKLFNIRPEENAQYRAAAEAAIAAVYPDSRNPFAFPDLVNEGHEPWRVSEVWMMAHSATNRYVDTTAAIDRKIAALMCHESQHVEPANVAKMVRDWGAANAVVAGFGDDRFAEGFYAFDA
mgnify:CR=1 FL=1